MGIDTIFKTQGILALNLTAHAHDRSEVVRWLYRVASSDANSQIARVDEVDGRLVVFTTTAALARRLSWAMVARYGGEVAETPHADVHLCHIDWTPE